MKIRLLRVRYVALVMPLIFGAMGIIYAAPPQPVPEKVKEAGQIGSPIDMKCFNQVIHSKPGSVVLCLGPEMPILDHNALDNLGIAFGPDMQMPIIKQPDGSFHLFFTGFPLKSTNPKPVWPGGQTFLLRVPKDLTDGSQKYKYNLLDSSKYHSILVVSGTTVPMPVLHKSCDCLSDTTEQADPDQWGCRLNADADYTGITGVFHSGTTTNPKHLIGIYHCQTDTFGGDMNCHSGDGFFAQVCLAKSKNGGKTWDRIGPIISGEPLPDFPNPHQFEYGTPQPAAIEAGGYFYAYYPYVASGQFQPLGSPCVPGKDCPKSTIQVARAPIQLDGKPGTWSKFYKGKFDPCQPGLYGSGTTLFELPDGGIFVRQPWVTYNTYLQKYVMTFICRTGWFFTTATDLEKQDWSEPQQFYTAPCTSGTTTPSCGIFTRGNQTDDNMIFFTPENASNQITGQTGLVLYAHTPAWLDHWDVNSLTFYARTFSFYAIFSSPPKCPPGIKCPKLSDKGGVSRKWVKGKCAECTKNLKERGQFV